MHCVHVNAWVYVGVYVLCHVYVCVGIVKTHSLGYQECDVVQAVFDKELSTSHLKISSKYVNL